MRETWALVRPWCDPESGYVEEIEEWAGPLPKSLPTGWQVWYAADNDDLSKDPDDRMVKRWRPSIHMPRWASRITLEVTEVCVERLQEIGEADAIAEGLGATVEPSQYLPNPMTAKERFAALWNDINGRRLGCGWELNPWVWALTFRRVETS